MDKKVQVDQNLPLPEEKTVVSPKRTIIPKYVNGTVKNTGILNVRKTPNVNSEVIGNLSRGESVKIELNGSVEKFYRVFLDPKRNSKEGFVLKQFIEV